MHRTCQTCRGPIEGLPIRDRGGREHHPRCLLEARRQQADSREARVAELARRRARGKGVAA